MTKRNIWNILLIIEVPDLFALNAAQSEFKIEGGSRLRGGANAGDANGGAPGIRRGI
jgi:hypothetical protein